VRGLLPDLLIISINFRDASRNIADTMIGRLEVRGALNPPHSPCARSVFSRFIENDLVGYDAQVNICCLVIQVYMVTDRQRIEKLSASFKSFASPYRSATHHHPFALASSYRSLGSVENVRERFESSIINVVLLDVKFLTGGRKPHVRWSH